MPLKQVITIILLAVILGTGAEYFFIIRNGGDPFADIARCCFEKTKANFCRRADPEKQHMTPPYTR
jgi:hypothetical protein